MKTIPNLLYSGATPKQVASDLESLVNFQSSGISREKLLSLIETNLLPHLMRYDRPTFQSMFNAFPSPEANLGAKIMLDYNQGVTNWQVSPGGAVLEELCCQALCRLFGLGPQSEATFMYSGTYANQQALYMALHRYAEQKGFDLSMEGIAGFKDPRRLAVLVSGESHFSLRHAVRILGLGEKSLLPLTLDENRRIDIEALGKNIRSLQKSHDVFCIVTTAGTTTTGAIDRIEPTADFCQQIGAWLHVDGAYGYAYKLVPELTHKFKGDTQADSIAWDPHKQLGAPIPNSVLFLKNRNEFKRMALHSSYFNRVGEEVPNPGIKSPPSTRPMSALPLVALLRGQGIKRVIEDLRSPLIAIRSLTNNLDKLPDVEVLHVPETGILCFRITPEEFPEENLDALQKQLYLRTLSSGERSISITSLDGKTALRLVVVSPHTTQDDLWETIESLRKLCGEFIT